jgi:hypothetical protein
MEKGREQMKLPYPVLDLTSRLRERWSTYFAGDHDRPRYVEEGIWRRTQHPENADQSGWTPESNSRRRIVHYRYRYGCGDNDLELQEFYLYHCLTVPQDKIDAQEESVRDLLAKGGWVHDGDAWRRGDLICVPTRYAVHPKDIEAGRALPADHASYEVVVRSENCNLPGNITHHPWHVLAGGIRVKDRRGEPTLVDDLSDIRDYLPFQVEVGCGTSFEAGVPPLHRLHEIYRVTSRDDNMPGTYSFTLDPDSDTLLAEVLATPEDKFVEFVEMFRACFLAEPTPALIALRELAERGHLVGPVITNNFDVLAARAGLEECFVRRYDQKIPDVPFFPEVKSLLVVGNHADRRQVQARARKRGMKIFFLDPEGFWLNGEFAPYPLEGAQTGDILCRQEATPGLTRLAELLG